MWQRVQSIFLGISILSLLLAIVYPIWVAETGTTQYKLFPIYLMVKENGAITGSEYIPYCITAVLIVSAITISIQEFRRFDNMLLQVKLGTLNSLLLACVMICDVVFSNQMAKAYPIPWNYGGSLWLTFGAVVCNWLAIRFIRRDQKLLKDSDRLR